MKPVYFANSKEMPQDDWWLAKLRRVVRLWVEHIEWERAASKPFSNRQRLAELEASMGSNLVEIMRPKGSAT